MATDRGASEGPAVGRKIVPGQSGRVVPVHNLRRNERSWSPPAVLFVDTEANDIPGTEPVVQALRLWASALIDRKGGTPPTDDWQWSDGKTAGSLADSIDAASRKRDTLWIYAHNLSYDLTTTRLPLLLAHKGWAITDCAVSGRAPWLRMARGRKRIALTDSWSWLPAALAEIGKAQGRSKPRLPKDADDDAAWLRRCRADVSILAHAICDLMDWWDANQLGNWTISGAATGWNAMRHKPSVERVVIDPDDDAVNADRAAHYGGRRGVWRVGTLRGGPFLELDFVAAYPTIAAHCLLPRKRTIAFDEAPLDHPAINHPQFGMLAEVVVETDVPRWPVRLGGAIWYPTGRFKTTLAGPDINEAARLGCLRWIGKGYVHALGMPMADWARWILDVQNGRDPSAPAVAVIAAKHWGRAVIGKWASHTFTRTELGPAPTSGWSYEPGWDAAADCQGGMLDLAGQRWWIVADQNGENAYPAIPAFVEAEVRTRLNRVIEAIGPGAVVQCDTDGLIVAERVLGTMAAHGSLVAPDGLTGAARTAWVLEALRPLTEPLRLRIKRQHSHVTVLGAQHVKLGRQRRFSGLPADAKETKPDVYRYRAWPKLAWQMGHGDRRGYTRPLITQKIEGPYPTGWITEQQRVIAPHAAVRAGGESYLVGWTRTGPDSSRPAMADVQHPYLDGLL
jgi:hypothetical protein